MNNEAQLFWENFLASLSPSQYQHMVSRKRYADFFCANESDANHCAHLVNIGQKTATSSLKKAYEIEGEALPQIGNLQIVTLWNKQPVCIIETVDIQEIPFSGITQNFAKLEGEGDLSLAFWRKVHHDFFTEACKNYGISFDENMLIICEQFKKIYPI